MSYLFVSYSFTQFKVLEAAPPTCLLEVRDEAHPLDFIILFFGGINSFILFWSKFFLETINVRSDLFTEVRVHNAQFRILSSSSSNFNFNKPIYTTTFLFFLCV